jgi:CsoR family transcriptional regulator, copper-sensing transcriptional repressor
MATDVGAVAAAHAGGQDTDHDVHHDGGQDPSRGPGYHDSKAAHLKRLRRIEGQVRGIARMVEEDQYCIDVLTQVSAATKALQAVALGLLDEHLSHCVVDAVAAGGEERDAKLHEASAAIARLVRS